MPDWLIVLLTMLGVPLLVFGVVFGPELIEYRGAPRGLRWVPRAWQKVSGAVRWALLRVFYPEEVKPAPKVEADPWEEVRRLELWHMAYELDYSPEQADGISRYLDLYSDTLRRWKMRQKQKENL